ncbi:MAG TPA: hypothetical protein VMM37_08695, partial [Bacteroidota bacterium]|nr:hypothetical protein [Bacteroidota bacterium]
MLFGGCDKSSTTGPSSGLTPVNMAISFSNSSGSGLMKSSGLASTDSIRIDSAVVVIARIKFESHIDTVVVDTVDGHTGDLDEDSNIAFKGPYVIHVRDSVALNFANQVLPAGTYDGIKFKIHRLLRGEPRVDSDDLNHHPRVDDSSIIGSSISVWGAVLKNGVWTNFAFFFNGEVEFKIKGTFTVAASTSTVNLAINFNMGSWFVNPMTGALLDPTDNSMMNRELIRMAIYRSFGKGRGGHDRGDGHPNDH